VGFEFLGSDELFGFFLGEVEILEDFVEVGGGGGEGVEEGAKGFAFGGGFGRPSDRIAGLFFGGGGRRCEFCGCHDYPHQTVSRHVLGLF
jgi:hypothetical protein